MEQERESDSDSDDADFYRTINNWAGESSESESEMSVAKKSKLPLVEDDQNKYQLNYFPINFIDTLL